MNKLGFDFEPSNSDLNNLDGLIDEILCENSTNLPSVLLSLLELPQESVVSVGSSRRNFKEVNKDSNNTSLLEGL